MDINETPDFDFELTLNEEMMRVRSNAVTASADEYTQMLRDYPNRLRVAAMKTATHESPGEGKKVTEISFNLIANPHPKCDFDYICIYLNFASWPEARITDLCPKEIKGDQPVKYVTKYTGSLTLKIDKVEIGPLFSAENSSENNVYFIKLRGIGIEDSLAQWTFEKEPHTRLYFNNLLTLLVEHDDNPSLEPPTLEVEANLRLEGWKGFIPIYGSKTISF